MEDKKVELLTYCVLDEKGRRNLACPLDNASSDKCEDYDNWKARYASCFTESYISGRETTLDVQKFYFDPDGSYARKNHPFFDHLISFLNKQEQLFSGKLAGSFRYSFEKDEGIKVASTDNPDEALFYLRSDQLGFSSPSNQKNHPYDLYLLKCGNNDSAIDQVAEWIAKTRTVGGSFLWPGSAPWKQSFYNKYNMARGGTTHPWSNHYGQDRVDLALLDVSNWYSNNSEQGVLQDVLDGLSGNRERMNLETWLNHFKDFKLYVEFFCFKGFVDKDFLPNCIVQGKSLPQSSKPEKPDITADLTVDDLEGMLNGLSENVVERSKAMLKIINNE